jgi:hypothetical protein
MCEACYNANIIFKVFLGIYLLIIIIAIIISLIKHDIITVEKMTEEVCHNVTYIKNYRWLVI